MSRIIYNYRHLSDTCHRPSIRAAQYQFLCIVIIVLLLCLCINYRIFLGNGPTHIRLPYASPKTFITAECGDERRLGNSMFTYASLLGIAHRNNMTPVIQEGIRLTRIFNIRAGKTDNIANTMLFHTTREEYGKRGCAHDISLMNLDSRTNVKLLGYLQSWKYFSEVEAEIRANYVFKDNVREKADKFFATLPHSWQGGRVTRVGIHVRRGDMTEGYYVRYGYITAPSDYFVKAMDYYRRNYTTVCFIVCSDDIAWAKENLAGDDDVAFSVANSEAVDLAILSSCDHSIISVGSFGWWAAWLANGTTIYYNNWPRRSTQLEYQVEKRDYFPPHWIPME